MLQQQKREDVLALTTAKYLHNNFGRTVFTRGLVSTFLRDGGYTLSYLGLSEYLKKELILT